MTGSDIQSCPMARARVSGLSVTRERIERFDTEGTGRMTIQRRPEGGTEVALSLPLRVRDRHDAAA